MLRFLKYLIVGFLVGFTLFFVAFLFNHPVGEASAMAMVGGFIYALFSAGFMTRMMKTAVLEVTPANKDPQKGIQWYEDEIKQQIRDMRFKKVGKQSGFEVYHPQGFRKLWEGRIELTSDAYHVRVVASRMMIRILSDIVEIKPLKL